MVNTKKKTLVKHSDGVVSSARNDTKKNINWQKYEYIMRLNMSEYV